MSYAILVLRCCTHFEVVVKLLQSFCIFWYISSSNHITVVAQFNGTTHLAALTFIRCITVAQRRPSTWLTCRHAFCICAALTIISTIICSPSYIVNTVGEVFHYITDMFIFWNFQAKINESVSVCIDGANRTDEVYYELTFSEIAKNVWVMEAIYVYFAMSVHFLPCVVIVITSVVTYYHLQTASRISISKK